MPKMTRQRIIKLVRNFKKNGNKMMLENAANVRDTIAIAGASWVGRIDFDTFSVSKTSFVRRDFRHVESDVVCTARLRGPDGQPLKKNVTIYILIEHQSQPDRLMPLRLVEYVSQINSRQLRDWSKQRGSQAGFKLHPVLPIVLYTGTLSAVAGDARGHHRVGRRLCRRHADHSRAVLSESSDDWRRRPVVQRRVRSGPAPDSRSQTGTLAVSGNAQRRRDSTGIIDVNRTFPLAGTSVVSSCDDLP